MYRSIVYLKEGTTGKTAEAELCDGIDASHLTLWRDTWKPAFDAFGQARPDAWRPEDKHWDWSWKKDHYSSLLTVHSFALLCEKSLQGLMIASDTESSRMSGQAGKPLVYVRYLATAPWNRPRIRTPPRYRGVGSVFLAAAVQLSLDIDYQGRVGLHSLPEAESFYAQCGMTAVQRDGPDFEELMYFEMTARDAKGFLERIKKR